MGEESSQDPAGEPTGGSGQPPSNSELKFSQADIDKIAGETRQKATAAAEKKLLESLGVSDLEAAKEALRKQREAEEAAKTEAQRLAEERDAAKAQAEAAMQQAHETLKSAALQGALRDAGINPERIAAAVRLVDRTSLAVENGEVTGVAEAIEALKGESPEWFKPPVVGAPDATGGRSGESQRDFSKVSKQELADHLRSQYQIALH